MCACVCVFLPVFESGGAQGGGLEVARRGRGKQFPRQAVSRPSHEHTHQPSASEVTQTDRQTQTRWGVGVGSLRAQRGGANEPGEAGPNTWTGGGAGAEVAEGGTPGGRKGDPHGVGAVRGHPDSLRNVRGPTSSATCVAASSPSRGGRNLGGQTGQDRPKKRENRSQGQAGGLYQRRQRRPRAWPPPAAPEPSANLRVVGLRVPVLAPSNYPHRTGS